MYHTCKWGYCCIPTLNYLLLFLPYFWIYGKNPDITGLIDVTETSRNPYDNIKNQATILQKAYKAIKISQSCADLVLKKRNEVTPINIGHFLKYLLMSGIPVAPILFFLYRGRWIFVHQSILHIAYRCFCELSSWTCYDELHHSFYIVGFFL